MHNVTYRIEDADYNGESLKDLAAYQIAREHWGTKSHRLAAAAAGEMWRLYWFDVQKLRKSQFPEHQELARRAISERPELA
jgi:hypothetical protein